MDGRAERPALIQETAHGWAQTLTALVKEHGRVHVLLNRLNGLDERLVAPVQAQRDQAPLLDPYFGGAMARTPLLVALTMAELPLLDLTAELAAHAAAHDALAPSPVHGWVVSPAATAPLADHLRRQMDLRLPGRGRAVYFGYFDHRVMPRLPHVLTPAQLAQLLGPVDLWAGAGRNGQLFRVHKPAPAEPPDRGSLNLAPGQAEALERLAVVNAVLRRLHAQGVRMPQPDDDARLDAFVVQARGLGLARPDDQAAYAALAHAWPPARGAMADDPWLQQGLALARAGVPLATYVQQSS